MTAIVDTLIAKLHICSGIMSKCRYFLSSEQLMLIFYCLGGSYLNYYSLICYNLSAGQLKKINHAYNHCGTIFYNCTYSHQKNFNWCNLYDLLKYRMHIFIHKLLHNGLCPPLKMKIITKDRHNQYQLRNNDCLPQLRGLIKIQDKKVLNGGLPKCGTVSLLS